VQKGTDLRQSYENRVLSLKQYQQQPESNNIKTTLGTEEYQQILHDDRNKNDSKETGYQQTLYDDRNKNESKKHDGEQKGGKHTS